MLPPLLFADFLLCCYFLISACCYIDAGYYVCRHLSFDAADDAAATIAILCLILF